MKKFISRFRVYLPVILFIGLLLIPELGFAQGADTSQGSPALKGLAAISGVIIEVLTFLALLMLNFFGDLLGTDMITGKAAMEAITPMWRWIRDLTNIMFVGVLLFLAFSNLFSSFGIGGEGGSWTIKEKLPKLIIAIIAINFSLLGFRVVIDAVNVGTVAIFGIADTKLQPDMSGMNTKLTTSRTWVKISPDQKDLMVANTKGVVKDDSPLKGVAGGNSCGEAWTKFINKPVNKEQCTGKDSGKGESTCALITVEKEGAFFACRGFRESINDLFCRKWVKWEESDYDEKTKADNKCVFMIKDSFETILTPKSEPGQNLFAAFGSVFMHLERLPALGAEINNLNDVVINTLFSVILALAFIVALIVVFIAMVGRLIVLWITLVFSPLLVGASILGIDGGKGGEISGKIVTHLIMPLKIAAAFAVGFVMMSAMVEWHGGVEESSFVFGAALSQLGQDEYSFLWQIATIVLFWMAAFWAVEGSIADTLIQQIKTGAEMLATTTAKTLTIDRPLFTVGTGGKDAAFSLGSVLQAPQAIRRAHEAEKTRMNRAMAQAFDIESSPFETALEKKSFTSAEDFKNFTFSGGVGEMASNYKGLVAGLNRSEEFEGRGALIELLERTKGDKDKMQKAMADGKWANYGLKADPWFASENSYNKPYAAGAEAKTKLEEEKIGDEGVSDIKTNKEKGIIQSNTVTYTDTEGETTTDKLETLISTIPEKDDTQLASFLGDKIKNGMVLTFAEMKALNSNSSLNKALKSQTGGFLPGLSEDSDAIKVEVINSDNEAKTIDINLETKTEDLKDYKTTEGKPLNITEDQLKALQANLKKEETAE